jgi:uncharacterized protein
MDDTLSRVLAELERDGQYDRLKQFRQHGESTVYDHSLNVARAALRAADRLNLKLDREALARGALLHDYFLYDWHVPDPKRRQHAFFHPSVAWENASRDYDLGETEEDIIRHHMFPVVPVPPHTKEGWIVSAMDTVCALKETLSDAAAKRKVGKMKRQEDRK